MHGVPPISQESGSGSEEKALCLPRVSHRAGAGVGRGVGGELAVELAEQRDPVGEAKLGTGGREGGVLRRRRAVYDKARAGKRLKRTQRSE
jgi:hypothetical protein